MLLVIEQASLAAKQAELDSMTVAFVELRARYEPVQQPRSSTDMQDPRLAYPTPPTTRPPL